MIPNEYTNKKQKESKNMILIIALASIVTLVLIVFVVRYAQAVDRTQRAYFESLSNKQLDSFISTRVEDN